MIVRLATFSLILLFTGSVDSADFYISPTGNDTNAGSMDSPVSSLAKAQSLAREFAGKAPVTVHVADGTYYLPETLVFAPADSGSKEFPVLFVADNEGGAVLSGGSMLDLTWQPHRDGIFMAKTPAGLDIDQLFIDGQNQRMARYPNYDATKKTEAYQGFAADAFSKQRAAGWDNPAGGYIHAMHRSRWGGYHYRITGKGPGGEVTYEGGWQNNRQMGMHNDFRMVENIFEELDAPGEWYHDAENNTLYFMPTEGIDLGNAVVEVVRLRHLIEFNGTADSPVRFITVKGFVFRHAARTFMETKEPMLRSDWTIYRGGAVLLMGTEDIQVLDCEFDQVGGNAIFASNYNRRLQVESCHIHDVGASGVCFVGDPDAVRDPLFEYRQKNDLSTIDRTPGPKTNNYPSDSIVSDCLIHGIGRVERQPAGVQIEMSSGITVRDCSIYDCSRAGINIGDGAWGGHLIERNDVFDTVLETHDHGSFNSWGRDRYWQSDRGASQDEVDKDPSIPFLDAMETTVIGNNRFRCDHGWDIDLDDGSSNYWIYNNLLLSGGLKLREGFRRRAWNNIAVNNGFHPHVWYNHSEDEVFSNLFMAPHRGARMPNEHAKGKRVDRNLFFVADVSIKDRFVQFGWDVNSIVADPMFVDPARGDFRVQEDSPALTIGFKNFPMDQFGVKKPSLKSIARTPVIPAVLFGQEKPAPFATAFETLDLYWLGAKLHELKGEEFSAYGVRMEDGGVALTEVPNRSEAMSFGLHPGDLIQSINGHAIATADSLLHVLVRIGADPIELKLVRDQNLISLSIQKHSFLQTELAADANALSQLSLPTVVAKSIVTNQETKNAPLDSLVDGKLAKGYGAVFGNGVHGGAYRIDLGTVQPVSNITSWSFGMNGRGKQRLTLYASDSTTDPGWNFSEFIPLSTISTFGTSDGEFTAASLRAPAGQSLGSYRWIVWKVSPISSNGGGENTAFQELCVGAD